MEYEIRILKSSQMSKEEIDDFVFVQQEVFPKYPMQFEDFKLKFLDNIYGDSIIVIAYDGATPAGARAFWRNDIDGNIAYQPSDTAVRSNYRKQGLFVKMTLPIIDCIGEHSIVYNFPNENSYPQYKKLGWEDYKIQYTRIFSIFTYTKEEPSFIPTDYFNWWVKHQLNENYGYVKILDKYYLVRQISEKGRFVIFGQLEKKCAKQLQQKHPLLLVYHSQKCPFYNRKKKIACKIVYKCTSRPLYIPSWKTDVY